MVFSSLTFIFIFLPTVLILYFSVNTIKYKNIIIFISSIIFYAWGEPFYVAIMFISILNDYIHAILVDRELNRGKEYKAKIFLVSSIIINLGLLIIFKYGNFIIENVNFIMNTDYKYINISLPIGISFYTFQTMSYTIDVYKREVNVQKKFFTLGTYVAMFPQLIAGPIVRYSTIEAELEKRSVSWDYITEGLRRFIIGLGKKVIIANQVALIADAVFNMAYGSRGLSLAWIGAIAYSLQIYFDFSGYSDMAIGLGRIFGFSFLENFNYPYISRSITEFWRRWHISLGTWFRDYLYIPLGGNRVKKILWLRNILIVWALTGLWHGAEWNFVLWGIFYALLIIIEGVGLNEFLFRLPKVFQHMYSLLMIIYGWVLFRCESLLEIKEYTLSLIGINGNNSYYDFYNMNLSYLFPFLILGVILSTPLLKNFTEKVNNKLTSSIYDLICIVILFFSVMLLVNDSFNPFIYYRF